MMPEEFCIMKNAMPAVAVLLAPRTAFACATCFGQSDEPMAKAMNMGILLMLGVVAVVLAGFAAFVIHLGRRAGRVAATASVAASIADRTDVRSTARVEGTA